MRTLVASMSSCLCGAGSLSQQQLLQRRMLRRHHRTPMQRCTWTRLERSTSTTTCAAAAAAAGQPTHPVVYHPDMRLSPIPDGHRCRRFFLPGCVGRRVQPSHLCRRFHSTRTPTTPTAPTTTRTPQQHQKKVSNAKGRTAVRPPPGAGPGRQDVHPDTPGY